MAVKKAQRTNKKSRFSKVTRVLNFSTTKGKFLVFMLTFAVLGGGVMAYQSFAATVPPQDMRVYYGVGNHNVVASDGVKGYLNCISVSAQTGYGPLAHCIQLREPRVGSTDQYRTGLYSTTGKSFGPTSGWLKHAPAVIRSECKNMNYYFTGTQPLASGYGNLSFGQIYRIASYSSSGAKWQIKWAQQDTATGNCYASSATWMDAKAWKNPF